MEEGRVRYKWTTASINLLIAVWSHEKIQKLFRHTSRNQPIWDSVARYMIKRGFSVTGLQCRTRIKNMLCTYQEAVRKNDRSLIDPYFDIFKKVIDARSNRSKEVVQKTKKSRNTTDTEQSPLDSDDETGNDEIFDGDAQNQDQNNYQVEYLDITPSELNTTENASAPEWGNYSDLQNIEKTISRAIDCQTKTITNFIKSQTCLIEKLLQAERDRLETIMASERENRRQLETILASEREVRKQLENKLDRLLSRFETQPAGQRLENQPTGQTLLIDGTIIRKKDPINL